MKNIGTLFCAIALAGAVSWPTHAQTAPAPTASGVATFTITATTGGATTVVMPMTAAAVPVPPPATGPAPALMTVTTPGAASVAAPPPPATTVTTTPTTRTLPAALPRPMPLPAAPALSPTPAPAATPAFPVLPRLPGVLGGGTPAVATPAGVSPALAAAASGTASTNADAGVQLNFRDAPIDQLLNMYGDLTGRTVIKGPMINAIITVRSQSSLTVPEAIQALESVLQLNGIALVPMGAKFVKVTKSELGRMESLQLKRGGKDAGPAETDQLASYIFTLKYIETDEVVPALQNVLHTYGKIQVLERANSVMLTDTSANLQRAQDIIEFMDVPPEARVETKIYELENGDAAMVAAQLQSIVDDAQGKTSQQRQRQPGVAPMPIPVVAPGAVRAPAVGGANGEALEEGLIQGKVKILADDRTNMIIIIARPSNFPFFERLIKELDRKVEPEVIVRVIQLQWSEADQIAGLLNDMLGSSGGAYGTRGAGVGGTTGVGGVGTGVTGARTTGSSSGLRRTSTSSRSSTSAARARTTTGTTAARPAVGGIGGAGTVNPFGNNAPNITTTTRVLADLRSNALLMMGTKEDIADLEKVVEKLDVMLSQVLIEAVILNVDLNKTTETGISWLQRSLQAYNQTSAGPGGGAQIRQPIASFGGGFNRGAENATIPNGASIANGFAMAPGLNYYTTISGLNLDTVIHLVNNSSEARILSTPVIMATDNEAAEIKNTTQYPVITSSTILTTGGGTTSSYEYKDIGIDLIVKPHINPNRMVVMDITQTADTIASEVTIDGNKVPVISKREIQGLVTVEDRTTIVLGGLIETTASKTRDSIPLLGNIPLLGWLFRSDSNVGKRTELLVLITPYVLKTPEEARAETARLHKNSEMKEVLLRGWSDSPLAKTNNDIEFANRKRTLFGKTVAPTNAVPATAAPAAK